MVATNKMLEVSAYMRKNFRYVADEPFDRWAIGRLHGDCEDHALTTLAELCGGSKTAAIKALLSGRARIIYTKTETGRGHAVLEYNGSYLCNRYQYWSGWRREYAASGVFKPYSRAMLVLKLTFGRIVG